MSSHSSYLILTHCSITIVSFADIEFSEVFLSTFHTFVSPMELMDALIKRFFVHMCPQYLCSCVCLCVCAFIYVYIHTHIRMYLRTYIYIGILILPPLYVFKGTYIRTLYCTMYIRTYVLGTADIVLGLQRAPLSLKRSRLRRKLPYLPD